MGIPGLVRAAMVHKAASAEFDAALAASGRELVMYAQKKFGGYAGLAYAVGKTRGYWCAVVNGHFPLSPAAAEDLIRLIGRDARSSEGEVQDG